MSVAALCTDCTSNTSLPSFSFNPENENLTKRYFSISNDFLGNTNTFAIPRFKSIKLLKETYEECSESNWDGEGAGPVKSAAFEDAIRFIDNLPKTISMPSDIFADSDGDMSMEWRKRKGLILNISFNGKNEIIYAGILGTSRPRGVLYFGTSIPREIIEKIQTIGL